MPLAFAHPAALWFLPAAVLPILFHLFFRLRRQVREFPSLMFFLRIDPRLSARRKIHEWLILLLRCLFIALLVLALARPLFRSGNGGGHVARLILIDNSGSMAAPAHPGESKLVLAERAAQKLIASSGAGDSVAVQAMIPDAGLPHGFDVAPALLHDAIGKMTSSDGAAPVARAIRLALATLNTARAPQHELHILTDLQRDNWSAGQLDSLPSGARIIIHRVSSLPLSGGSASLELTEIPARAIPAGRLTPVRAGLENHGSAPAHVRLNSTDDSGKSFSREIEIAPHASTTAALTFSFSSPGFHWAQVWIEGDVAPSASRAGLGFWCVDPQKVFFVGSKTDFAALPYAVSPGGSSALSGIDASFIAPDQLAQNLSAHPLAVVLNWDAWPADSAALETYVHQGGTLFIVPGAGGGVSVSRPTATWLDADLGPMRAAKQTEPIMLLQDGDALWHDLRNGEGRPHLGTLRVFQYRPVKVGSDWQELAASGQGATLLARREIGTGRIFVSGLAFAPKWSSLPLKPGFVVLVQNAIFGERSEHLPVQPLPAASDFQFDFPGEHATVRSLAGSALDWQGPARDFAGFPRAGIYEIKQREQVTWVATTANPAEANPDFLPLAPVPLLRDLPQEIEPLSAEEDILRTQSAGHSGTSWYRWLMLAALLVLLAETWLANERSSDLGRNIFSSLRSSVTPRKKSTHAARKPEPVAA